MVDLLPWQQKTLKHWTLNSTKSCLSATWENFEVTFGIFSVLVSQINVLESYLDICFKASYDKKCGNCDNSNQSFTNILSLPKKMLQHFFSLCISLIFPYCLFVEKIDDDWKLP